MRHSWAGILVAAGLCAAASAEPQLPRRAGAADETYPAHDVIYDSVRTPKGERVRLIVTRPHDARNLPVVFLAGWLSCDSVEAPNDTKEAIGLTFRRIAGLSSFALVRMEKPGVGDSEGDCAELDFNAELAAYRAVFRHMLAYNFIDKTRVFVLGLSNGAGWAPLVAEGVPVKGYVIAGGWVKTWFEHMMEIERRRFALMGKSPGEVNEIMPRAARLYTGYLVVGRPPSELLKHEPALAEIWPGEGDRLYGRPTPTISSWELNLAEAWSRVRAPTLVLYGENDWIMSRDDHETIVALVNRNTKGAATLAILPGADHSLEKTASRENAFAGKREPFDGKAAELIANWLVAHR
ncbi:MAG: alpha/beta hydrolase [Alphaproteobacteria bacterium]